MVKPILADFNKSDGERLILTCVGTLQDLESQNIILADGLKLTFYDKDVDINGNPDDLIVEGIVRFDSNLQNWIAEVKWDEIKSISKLSTEERQNLGI